jgi:hypothetical protein
MSLFDHPQLKTNYKGCLVELLLPFITLFIGIFWIENFEKITFLVFILISLMRCVNDLYKLINSLKTTLIDRFLRGFIPLFSYFFIFLLLINLYMLYKENRLITNYELFLIWFKS